RSSANRRSPKALHTVLLHHPGVRHWRREDSCLWARMRNRILSSLVRLCGYQRRHFQDMVGGVVEGFLQAPGQYDAKNCSAFSRAFHDNLPPMILNDLLHYCQSQPSAVFLAVTNERMEQFVLN